VILNPPCQNFSRTRLQKSYCPIRHRRFEIPFERLGFNLQLQGFLGDIHLNGVFFVDHVQDRVPLLPTPFG
jgi:hypothetical protein